MNLREIESRVANILIRTLGVKEEDIKYNADLKLDLGCDSLDVVELVMEVEKEFNISISDDVADKMGPTLGDAYTIFFKNAPREFITRVKSQVLCFKFNEAGKVEVVLKLEDGSWTYADGVSKLPSSICVINFTKWTNILKELEEIINAPSTKEKDLQDFFERYPELIAGNDYDIVLPQAVIIRDDSSQWKPDFILTPKNQREFAKVLDLKIPTMDIVKRPQSNHYNFSAKLWNGIMQVKDYSREFDKTSVRERFKKEYKVDVYKPDLHLIAGRKWDIKLLDRMRELQRETQVKIEDWDTALDRLKRNFC